MSYPRYRSVRMDELSEGMIVLAHGLRCLVDRPIHVRLSQNGGESHPVKVYSTNALVLNRQEVPRNAVPLSFTSTASYPSRGMPAEPEGTHRWGLQGTAWVTVAVEPESM